MGIELHSWGSEVVVIKTSKVMTPLAASSVLRLM